MQNNTKLETVISDLFTQLGLGLDMNSGRIIDQDTYQYLLFNNNYVVAPNAILRHRRDTVLDVLGNNKLAEYFMNVMISKESQENGLYIQVLSTEEFQSGTSAFIKKRLVAKTNFGEYYTGYYYNYCLCCIDMIFQLGQFPARYLHELDYTEEYIQKRLEEQQTKTKGRGRR